MPTFYGAIDLSKNELRNAVVQNLASAPGTPTKGQIYYDSTGNILYWYNGSGWIAAQGGAGAVPATTVTTQAVGDAAVVGAATTYAREDHKHGRESFGAVTAQTAFGAASANGSAVTLPRSDHTHGTPVHDNAAHSAINLSALAVPTASLNLNSQRIINLADPTGATDGANKQYVDNMVAGLTWKSSADVASTTNVALSGVATPIDGVTIFANWRVLLKNQTNPAENGLWIANTVAWVRATDADSANDLIGAAVFIEQGTTNADTAWVCTTDAPITIGSTPLTFVQFAGGATVTAGAGMTQSGNTLNVVAGDTSLTVAADDVRVNTAVIATVASLAGYTPTTRTVSAGNGLTGGGDLSVNRAFDVVAGDTSLTVAADSIVVNTGVIATAASVTAKADKTTTVTAGAGLTGGGDLSANRTLDVVAGDTSLTVAADSIVVNTGVIATVASVTAAVTGMAKKFAAALTGTASPETVTHNLNTRDIQLTVLNGASPYTAAEVDWDATTVNTAVVRYNPNLGAGYRVVVMG